MSAQSVQMDSEANSQSLDSGPEGKDALDNKKGLSPKTSDLLQS